MAAHQAPPSTGFSRQECWSGLPFPSPLFSQTSPIFWLILLSTWSGLEHYVDTLILCILFYVWLFLLIKMSVRFTYNFVYIISRSCSFLKNSFIDIYSAKDTIHPFKVHSSAFSSIFKELCNYHQNLTLNIFNIIKEIPYTSAVIPHSPPKPAKPPKPMNLSTFHLYSYACSAYFDKMDVHIMLSFVTGFFHLPSCFQDSSLL